MPPLRTYLQSFTQLARYLLWLLRDVERADGLLRELGASPD